MTTNFGSCGQGLTAIFWDRILTTLFEALVAA
jgi:hypothetical protein